MKLGSKLVQRGRGALSNDSSRFDREKRELIDDGWDSHADQTNLKSEHIPDASQSILSYNKSPDIPFDRSINPYRGCEHGCIYCFARPSHAYLGYSPGLDFESKILYKPRAIELLRRELAKPSYRVAPIMLGSNTDPYQPIERDQRITRELLEFLREHRHPVAIVTKGALIERDMDVLTQLAKMNLVHVMISVTTLDNGLHRAMEPRAMAPHKRITMMNKLAAAKIPVGVMAAPMIPKLNDYELESIFEIAHQNGAKIGHYIPLRLPHEIQILFREWLDEHYPDRAKKVWKYILELHGGRQNTSNFGERMRGQGQHAKLLHQRARIIRTRLGYDEFPAFDLHSFRPPSANPDQLSLF